VVSGLSSNSIGCQGPVVGAKVVPKPKGPARPSTIPAMDFRKGVIWMPHIGAEKAAAFTGRPSCSARSPIAPPIEWAMRW
jgi:hypothetical protein